MASSSYIAIDLGAGSGRVILGTISENKLDLEIIHRFPNGFKKKDGHDRWDLSGLWAEIQTGLKKIGGRKESLNLRSVGADTWGVDYGLFDKNGKLLEEPVAYRDHRTQGVMDKVFRIIPDTSIYKVTGIQFMPFNTIFQLYAHIHQKEWPVGTQKLLLMPDIIHYFLCGKMAAEYTIASTSQLLDVNTKDWNIDLFDALELVHDVMPPISMPGSVLGVLSNSLITSTGLPPIPVVLPAAHDTGSAVAGAPLQDGWAYISSGTWSLVGIESDKPYSNEKAFKLNYTNEGGVYGTIRFLKNITGLWILESCRKEWEKQGVLLTYDALIRDMEKLPFVPVFINPDDPLFLNPESMLSAISEQLEKNGQKTVWGQAELSAIILQSLALRYACVISEIEDITGRVIKGIQVVGGGSQNMFLNQLTADATGLPVMAGPVEATALGNILIQAITDKRFVDLAEARDFVRKCIPQASFKTRQGNPLKQHIAAFKSICRSVK